MVIVTMTFSRRHFRKFRSASTRAARRRSGAVSLAMARRKIAVGEAAGSKRGVVAAGKDHVRPTIGIVRRIGEPYA
jgi:hypothetical protein